MNKSIMQRLVLISFLCVAVGRVRASNQASGEQVENTHWRLVRLRDSPIVAASLQREAYLVLNSASRRVTGSGGCNQISGSYKLKRDQLTFGHMSVTMMACARGMETEKDFLAELRRTAKWKIEGPDLELFDAGGTMVARFERGPTKVNYGTVAKPLATLFAIAPVSGRLFAQASAAPQTQSGYMVDSKCHEAAQRNVNPSAHQASGH